MVLIFTDTLQRLVFGNFSFLPCLAAGSSGELCSSVRIFVQSLGMESQPCECANLSASFGHWTLASRRHPVSPHSASGLRPMILKTGQFSETLLGNRASRWLLELLTAFHPLSPLSTLFHLLASSLLPGCSQISDLRSLIEAASMLLRWLRLSASSGTSFGSQEWDCLSPRKWTFSRGLLTRWADC